MGNLKQVEKKKDLEGSLFIGSNGLVSIKTEDKTYQVAFKDRKSAIDFLSSDNVYTLLRKGIPVSLLNEIKSEVSKNNDFSKDTLAYYSNQYSSPIEITGKRFTQNTSDWLTKEIENGNIKNIDKFIKDNKLEKNSKGEYFITSTQIANLRPKKPLEAIAKTDIRDISDKIEPMHITSKVSKKEKREEVEIKKQVTSLATESKKEIETLKIGDDFWMKIYGQGADAKKTFADAAKLWSKEKPVQITKQEKPKPKKEPEVKKPTESVKKEKQIEKNNDELTEEQKKRVEARKKADI